MIAKLDDIIDNPEAHCTSAIVGELARMLKEATNFERGEFVSVDNHDEVMFSPHFMQAMSALTERKAYSKSECAMLIAEKAYEAERLAKVIDAVNDKLAALAELAETRKRLMNQHVGAFAAPNSVFKRDFNFKVDENLDWAAGKINEAFIAINKGELDSITLSGVLNFRVVPITDYKD